MSTPTAHEHWDELAAAYALHALDGAEETAFLDHLATCVTCRRSVDEHALVAAQLGALAAGTDPGGPRWADLRAGVLGQGPAVREPAPRRRPRAHAFLAAAAALVVVAGAAVAWRVTTTDERPGPSLVASCAARPGCHVVRLADAAVVLAEAGTARVVPTSLHQPATDRIYALWQLPRDGRPVLVGTLRDGVSGPSQPAALAIPYEDTAAFAVSLEPVAHVPTQPTTVVAVGAANS